MRIVLDANVLIAAFATRGLCHSVFEHCLDNHTIVLCDTLLHEVTEKLRVKVKVPRQTVEEVERFLMSHAMWVEPTPVPPDACPDRDDLMVLGTAVAARASCLISGDRDLLGLGSYLDIPILSPRMFWEKERERRHRSG